MKENIIMMNVEILIPISFFIVTAFIIKVISDNKIRHRLIEKGEIDEKIKYLFTDKIQLKNLSSLKWGLVLTGIGLALFVGQLFPYAISEEMTIGGMFMFAGFGFIIYYILTKRMTNETAGQVEQSKSK